MCKKMITRNDIKEYFDLEAEASKNKWEALMKLPVKERIHKCRAIQSVYLNRDYHKFSDDGLNLIKISVGVNLADFKEGEYLLLHKDNSITGIPCTLFSFVKDDEIILAVFHKNWPIDFDTYYDEPLLLDRNQVDLREHVYRPFTAHLYGFNRSFWEKLIFNTKPSPTFENEEANEEELDDTIMNFKLDLLSQQKEAVLKSMSAKDYYLIQGPPGTGKSFTLALIMLEEIGYFKHKVIVIGPNHLAINNALDQVLKTAPGFSPIIYKVGQSNNAPTLKVSLNEREYGIENFTRLNSLHANNNKEPWLIGLTPHSLYTSRARDLECDTLIIDEAGQMSIPLALMGMVKAQKVILAGDHKQLPPIISSDKVGKEMSQSAFQLLVTKDNCTMLNVSFRMCEPICNFVSELFYDGKIKPKKKGCGNQIICSDPLFDFRTPIVIHHIEDYGEQTSDKEAEFIATTISGFVKKGLPENEMAVLAPFRAQAANVRRHIRKLPDMTEEQQTQIVADTIDKMQGQEREVIIFSLVSGNLDYMTEMAEFLYNPNKMNVAFSRAKSKLIIVGNIEQVKKFSATDYPHLKRMMESKYVEYV